MLYKTRRNFAVSVIIISIAIIVIIVTAGFAAGEKKDSPRGCVLKAYRNTVALFVDGELERVYSDIVLDTLPEQDIYQLKNGIAFDTKEEAERAIEDYDG